MGKIKPITISGMQSVNFDHPTLIPDNHWADSMNMVMANDGLWENRKGVKTFSNDVGSNKPVHSLHFWESEAPTITATTIAFVDSDPDTITDSGNGFLTARFRAGDSITVSGSTSNDGTYTIASVVAGTITLDAGDELSAEAAGDTVTITAPARRDLTVGSGTALYSYSEGSSYNDGTFTSRQTGFTDGEPFSFAQYQSTLLATNGTDSMYSSVDNFSWTERTGGDTQKPKYVVFANDTGYCANTPTAKSTVYYGATVPANPWDFAEAVNIEKENGQDINGLTNLGPIIICGKDRSIYSVDIATPSREQLDYGEGLIAGRSIVRALNSVYLASEEGVFTLGQRQGTTGSLAANPVSDPIQALWDKLISKEDINGIYFAPTRSIYWTVETSERTYTIVYNVRFSSWTYLIGVNAKDWTVYEESDGTERLIYGDKNDDKIRELLNEDREDDGIEIQSQLITKRFDFGTGAQKLVHYIDMDGYGSDGFEVDYEIYFDNETVASVTGTIDNNNLVSDSSVSGELASGSLASGALSGYIESGTDLTANYWFARIPLEKSFRTIQIKLSNVQAGVRWRFRSATLMVEAESEDLIETNLYE
jgi:hypothetical protein